MVLRGHGVSLVTAVAFGCCTVSYKLGGTPGGQQAACVGVIKEGRLESPDFERCMEEQGWTVKQFRAAAAPNDAKERVYAQNASARAESLSAAGNIAACWRRNAMHVTNA
jgi:hypothetical protein